MHSGTPRPAGLSPTLRQLMILVLGMATLLAAFIGLMRNGLLGQRADIACLNVALLIAGWPVPWMMTLLYFLDRRGPIRNWYIARFMAGWGLLAGIALLLADPVSWVLCGRTTIVFPVLPITALVCLWALPKSWQSVRPGRCLRCGRESVIVVATRFVPPRIRIDAGWCATCGAAHEREGTAAWTLRPTVGDQAVNGDAI